MTIPCDLGQLVEVFTGGSAAVEGNTLMLFVQFSFGSEGTAGTGTQNANCTKL